MVSHRLLLPLRRFWITAVFSLLIIFSLSQPAQATSYHTITIDGTNDFAADEDIAGTSGSTWYFTWSATHLYFGVNASPDVGGGSATKFVTLYLDTNPQQNPLSGNGTSTGVLYNTQQPTLPFNADYHFRWRTDNTYTNMLDWNNGTSSWTDDNTGNNNFGITYTQSGNFVEFAIPRSSLGNPTAVYAAGAMINEQAGVESTFFMFPNGNSPGYNANFTNYRGFVLNASLAPDHAANNNCLTTYQVTNTASSGANTLYEAVNNLCNDGTITFNVPANSTITFTSQATLNRTMFINGATATNLTVSGGNTRRIFDVLSPSTVRMAGFTLSNGNGFDGSSNGDGGAMFIRAGATALMTLMTVTNNTVANSFYGGGIANLGFLSLTQSTISNNTIGGGVANFGSLQIARSLFSNNSAFEGGGLYIDLTSPLVTITNSTFANNSAFEGGAIRSGATGVTMLNNTLANNTATSTGGGLYLTSGTVLMTNNLLGDNSNGDCVIFAGTIPTNVNNLIETTSTCTSGAVGLIQADPVLGSLANNGGSTLTIAPLALSPAINQGHVATCNGGSVGGIDQRSQRHYPTVCDIGAYQTVVVTSANDTTNSSDAICTLREAITAVNSNLSSGSGAGECPSGSANSQDAISFYIAGAGVQTIAPASALPVLTGSTGINGLTQPGTSCSTTPLALLIQLSGGSAGAGADGLSFTGSTNRLHGLVINQFNGDGVEINGGNNTTVTCSHIGTTVAGTAASANGGAGVHIVSSNNNVIGGTTGDVNNVIAYNTGRGVWVESGSGNTIDPNSIHSNGGIGIELGTDGVTANDSGDGDTGVNALQNFPVLTSIVTADLGATATINGSLNSTANTTFRLEFFGNTACDSTNFGEGELFIAAQNVTTDGAGTATFAIPNSVSFVGRTFIAGTATNLTTGDTSEFSACVQAQTPTAVSLSAITSNGRSTLPFILLSIATVSIFTWILWKKGYRYE